MEHSNVMGGSTAGRRMNCPGSYEAEKDLPDQGDPQFRDRGSMLHAAMEMMLTADPETPEKEQEFYAALIGEDLGFEGHEIDQELIDTKIIPAWEAWKHVRDEYDFDDWFIEQRVSLGTVIEGAFGTSDLIAKDTANRLHVLDWKFGDGVVVEAENNLGLGFYAACALYDEEPELKEFCAEISGVVLHIVQPRVGSSQVLSSWETTEEWVENLVDAAAAAMDQARKPDAPLKAGAWCGFCKARPTCPAQTALATEALSLSPVAASSIDLAQAMRLADQLKTWISEVYKVVQAEMEAGAAIPGYKLVNKMPRRVWADAEEAEKRMRAAKVKVGDMFTRKLITPTQAEKFDRQLYSKKLADIVVMHSSGLTVVHESDKRQAVTSGAELLANALPDPGKSK